MDDRGQIDGLSASYGLNGGLSSLSPFHSGPRHKLYRSNDPRAAIVVKMSTADAIGKGAVESLRHEFELLRSLDLPGVVKVLELIDTASGSALLMQDAGDRNLAHVID